MLKGLLVGILLGVVGVAVAVYAYFASGRVPVSVTAPDLPFEHKMTHLALDAYLAKLPHPDAPMPAEEPNLLAGAEVYRQNCAVCHGLPGAQKTAIASGMYPKPPELFHGVGVTDDEAWETYWKVENGIRMTGMPGFKGPLGETEIWQVTVLLKNADKLTPAVRAALALAPAQAAPVSNGASLSKQAETRREPR